MDELIANLAFGTTQPGYRCMIISYTGAVSKFSSQNKAIYDLIRPMHDYLDDLIGIIGDLFEFRDWHNQRINSKSSTPRYLIDHTTDSDNMLSTPASYELTHAHSSRKPIVFFHTENSNIVLEKIGSF